MLRWQKTFHKLKIKTQIWMISQRVTRQLHYTKQIHVEITANFSELKKKNSDLDDIAARHASNQFN